MSVEKRIIELERSLGLPGLLFEKGSRRPMEAEPLGPVRDFVYNSGSLVTSLNKELERIPRANSYLLCGPQKSADLSQTSLDAIGKGEDCKVIGAQFFHSEGIMDSRKYRLKVLRQTSNQWGSAIKDLLLGIKGYMPKNEDLWLGEYLFYDSLVGCDGLVIGDARKITYRLSKDKKVNRREERTLQLPSLGSEHNARSWIVDGQESPIGLVEWSPNAWREKTEPGASSLLTDRQFVAEMLDPSKGLGTAGYFPGRRGIFGSTYVGLHLTDSIEFLSETLEELKGSVTRSL